MGGGGGVVVRKFSQFRNFPQFSRIAFRPSPSRAVGALRVPCGEVLLVEAAGGLVTGPQF